MKRGKEENRENKKKRKVLVNCSFLVKLTFAFFLFKHISFGGVGANKENRLI